MNKFRIRILEDDPDDRDFMSIALRNINLVDTVDFFMHATSKDLLQAMDQERIEDGPCTELVVLDQNLANGDLGYEILRKVREINKEIVAVIVTGGVSEEVLIDFIRAQIDDFIKKNGAEFINDFAKMIERAMVIAEYRINTRKQKDEILSKLNNLQDDINKYVKKNYP